MSAVSTNNFRPPGKRTTGICPAQIASRSPQTVSPMYPAACFRGKRRGDEGLVIPCVVFFVMIPLRFTILCPFCALVFPCCNRHKTRPFHQLVFPIHSPRVHVRFPSLRINNLYSIDSLILQVIQRQIKPRLLPAKIPAPTNVPAIGFLQGNEADAITQFFENLLNHPAHLPKVRCHFQKIDNEDFLFGRDKVGKV